MDFIKQHKIWKEMPIEQKTKEALDIFEHEEKEYTCKPKAYNHLFWNLLTIHQIEFGNNCLKMARSFQNMFPWYMTNKNV